jgi:hypothetical protein
MFFRVRFQCSQEQFEMLKSWIPEELNSIANEDNSSIKSSPDKKYVKAALRAVKIHAARETAVLNHALYEITYDGGNAIVCFPRNLWGSKWSKDEILHDLFHTLRKVPLNRMTRCMMEHDKFYQAKDILDLVDDSIMEKCDE